MCESDPDTTARDTSGCCDTETETGSPESNRDAGYWLDDADVLDAYLSDELRSALGRFVGNGSIDTLGEWAADVRRLTGSGAIDVEQLCHTDVESDHRGEVGDQRYYFECFYDAVILAAVEDRPVDIHTVSPGGAVIEARAVGGDELSVTPDGAIFSMGIHVDAHQRSGGDPTLQDGYAAICPYVKAFPDREAYERWVDTAPAATVAMPLAGATEVARALVA